MTKGERNKDKRDRERDMTKKRDQLKFEHTSRGSKLMNLFDAFECAFTYACLHLSSFNLKVLACVVYASCRFE
jgi:hypothetical protein